MAWPLPSNPRPSPDFFPPDLEASSREACERFTAGYIQCMHDVHTFVSTCPGIEETVAAELLNHLMESMPLNDEDRLRSTQDGRSSSKSNLSPYGGEYAAQVSPVPSSSSGDDLDSDLDETESEHSHISSSEEAESQDLLSFSSLVDSKSPWRPW